MAAGASTAGASAAVAVATAFGAEWGATGLKISTVAAPVMTRISPAMNGALSCPNDFVIVAFKSVLTTGAPPKTSGMT